MKKNKILLAVVLLVVCIFGLSGCKKDPVVIKKIFVNAPDYLVYDVTEYTTKEQFEKFTLMTYNKFPAGIVSHTGLESIWVMSNGTVEVYDTTPSSITADVKNLDFVGENFLEGAIATVHFTHIKEAIRGEGTFQIFLKGSASAGDTPLMLNVSIDSGSFTHILGDTFKYEELIEEGKITATHITSGGTVVDVSNQLSFIDVNPRVTDTTRYNGGVYELWAFIDEMGTKIPVNVVGGEQPLNINKYPKWFDKVLVIPFGYIMAFVSFGGFFAIGIILTTIIVRTIAWPIYASTNNMSARMNEAKPDIEKLERKYANRTDKESMQRKQMEMMQIYKKHKVNFLGCLTPIIQFPIFTAMWQVVRRIMAPGGMFNDQVTNPYVFGFINLQSGAGDWGWVHIMLVALVGISMIILTMLGQMKPKDQKKTMDHQPKNEKAAQQQKTMKMMTYMMTIMMVFFAFQSNNAMSFYWIIGNIYSIGQNLLMKYLNKRKKEKINPLDAI